MNKIHGKVSLTFVLITLVSELYLRIEVFKLDCKINIYFQARKQLRPAKVISCN